MVMSYISENKQHEMVMSAISARTSNINDGDVSCISENKQHEIMMVMSAISVRTSNMR